MTENLNHYEEIYELPNCSHRIIRIGNHFGLVDEQGRELVPCIIEEFYGFSHGVAPLRTNSKWGLYSDKFGYIAPEYDELVCETPGNSIMVEKCGSWGFIRESDHSFFSMEEYAENPEPVLQV